MTIVYVVYDGGGHEHGTFDKEADAYACRDECEDLYEGTFYVEDEDRA